MRSDVIRAYQDWLVRHLLAALAGMLVLAMSTQQALAAGDDAAIDAIVDKVLAEEYASASFGDAQTKLSEALTRCLRKGCSTPVKARIYVALGMVASQVGKADEAKTQFQNAQKTDAAAKIPERTTPSIKNAWAEVTAARAAPTAPVTGAGAAAGTAATGGAATGAGAGAGAAEVPAAADTTTLPPGWRSAEAFKLAMEAVDLSEASKFSECMTRDQASLKIEDQPRTKLHLAGCEYKMGKLKDALLHSTEALQLGIAKRDAQLMKVAQERVKQLTERMPKITFVPPVGVANLQVTFDTRPVPVDALTRKFSIDPGEHTVQATGKVNGFDAEFTETFTIKEREVYTSNIILSVQEKGGGILTKGQKDCLARAKSQEEIRECLPQNKQSLVVKLATDASVYADTTRVLVFSPGVNASVVSPTAGWNISGSYLLDVVSAASPDIVSHASPPFREVRHAGSLSAGMKFGTVGVQATGNISREPDYLSLTGGATVTVDMNDKLITPRFGYSYTNDTIRRGPAVEAVEDTTADKPFPRTLTNHQFEAGVTLVMSPTTVLVLGGTAQFERGDQSKPYRYVPMFAANIAPAVPAGASIRRVDVNRLALRPLEQLPTERDRYAVAARLIKRIGLSSTLRLESRFYLDTWGTKAVTVDARYLLDVSKRVRFGPHVRLNGNTGVSFFKRAYVATADGNNVVSLPAYRTGDRELSPMASITTGGNARFAIGDLEGETKFGITTALDVMYSQFFDSLFVTRRTAIYATVALDVEF